MLNNQKYNLIKKKDATQEKYWKQFTEDFNRKSAGPLKTIKCLKTKYEQFKKTYEKRWLLLTSSQSINKVVTILIFKMIKHLCSSYLENNCDFYRFSF